MSALRQTTLALVTLLLTAALCFAEDPQPPKFYKMDFVVKEVDGAKILNSRAYSTIVQAGNGHAEIRAGSKVPVPIGGNNVNSSNTAQYQIIDIGVNFDILAVKEFDGRLAFHLGAEVSSVAKDPALQNQPVIRQNRWSSDTIVVLKKPTVVLSSENLDARTLTQIEVTATPISLP